jgi:hypothetical protein
VAIHREDDTDKLQLSLAGAAISLLAYSEQFGDLPGQALQPFEIAQWLGYKGDSANAAVGDWLKKFYSGPVAKRVADRQKTD